MFTRTLPLFALLLALPLAACGGDDTAEDAVVVSDDVPTADVIPGDVLTDAPEVDVPGTIAALEGGITAIPMVAATDNINGWIATLSGTGHDEIVTSLEALRNDLQSNPLDGAAIGAHLTRLGDLTTAAASGASSSSQESLTRLGSLLSEGGAMLTGGDA